MLRNNEAAIRIVRSANWRAERTLAGLHADRCASNASARGLAPEQRLRVCKSVVTNLANALGKRWDVAGARAVLADALRTMPRDATLLVLNASFVPAHGSWAARADATAALEPALEALQRSLLPRAAAAAAAAGPVDAGPNSPVLVDSAVEGTGVCQWAYGGWNEARAMRG